MIRWRFIFDKYSFQCQAKLQQNTSNYFSSVHEEIAVIRTHVVCLPFFRSIFLFQNLRLSPKFGYPFLSLPFYIYALEARPSSLPYIQMYSSLPLPFPLRLFIFTIFFSTRPQDFPIHAPALHLILFELHFNTIFPSFFFSFFFPPAFL